ncbi:MAG: acetyl-CoA C-acetyltransferase, partial [Pseudomonadota bacterium]
MSEEFVWIVGGARTPMGALGGSLAAVTAPELAAVASRATLERTGVDGDAVDEVFMGCVLPAGLRQCPARQTAIAAGVPVNAGAVTVNKACGSGMQATIFGVDSIRVGTNRVVLAGGMESMSNAPHLLPGARSGFRLGS